MARSRNIKPGFFTNEDLVELDFATRLLFAGLWTIADRDGRLEDRPKKIKINVFPADNVDVELMLSDLHKSGFIQRYSVNGVAYVQITNWTKHQNPHHTEKASNIPAPNGDLTVKQPLDTKDPPEQDGGNLADSGFTDSLIPDSSEAKASGGEPPAKTVDELTKDELWAAGKSLLSQAGMPAKQCGTFVGKLVKDYDAETVIEAVRVAVVERPADPAAYLKAVCQQIAGERKPAQPLTFAQQDELDRRRRWEETTGRPWPDDNNVIDITPTTLGIAA